MAGIITLPTVLPLDNWNECFLDDTSILGGGGLGNVAYFTICLKFAGFNAKAEPALLKYKLHTDQVLFDRAYAYIKEYY